MLKGLLKYYVTLFDGGAGGGDQRLKPFISFRKQQFIEEKCHTGFKEAINKCNVLFEYPLCNGTNLFMYNDLIWDMFLTVTYFRKA